MEPTRMGKGVLVLIVGMLVAVFSVNNWISPKNNNTKTIVSEGARFSDQGTVAPVKNRRLSPPVIDPENDFLAPVVKTTPPPVQSSSRQELEPKALKKVNELPLQGTVLDQ